MKKLLTCLAFGLILLGCNRLKDGAPNDLIDADKMARILVELHKTEAITSRLSFNTFDSSKVAFDYLETQVLEKFEVDSSQYRRSYEYYASNPDEFVRIYETVEKMAEVEPEDVQ